MNYSSFHVEYWPPKIFLCGGLVDNTSAAPCSLRHHFILHCAGAEIDLHNALVLAEDFKDYFKENAYSNLMRFEDDIAKISTLIVIFLESAGSLVEFGLFCNSAIVNKKLLVVAPSEEVENKDSFIFLGPLEYLSALKDDSVSTFPWPKKDALKYEHMELLVSDVKEKLDSTQRSEGFNPENPAHLTLLLHDIVVIAEPITFMEIDAAIKILGLDVREKDIKRLLYLAEKLKLVSSYIFSKITYYHYASHGEKRIKFGAGKNGQVMEASRMKIAFRQHVSNNSESSEKRRWSALAEIAKLRGASK